MSQTAVDFAVRRIDAVRVVGVEATLKPHELSERVGGMFDDVASALEHARGALDNPIATYIETAAGMHVVVGYGNSGPAPDGTQLFDLPEATAVCGTHHGPISGIQESWAELHSWMISRGYVANAACRERYVRAMSEDQEDWVIELQQPISS